MYPLGRPHRVHRFRTLVGYFRLASRIFMHFLATFPPYTTADLTALERYAQKP